MKDTRLKEIKFLRNEVFELLSNGKDLYKDNDNALCARIWANRFEKEGLNIEEISAKKFLNIYATMGLPSSDSITRQRRKLQELHPELRGASYVERQAHAKEVSSSI